MTGSPNSGPSVVQILRRFDNEFDRNGGHRSSGACAVVPRFKRGIQYAAASRLDLRRLWNTGRIQPVKPGDDVRRAADDTSAEIKPCGSAPAYSPHAANASLKARSPGEPFSIAMMARRWLV